MISQTGATSTPTGIRLTTADEDATDKTPSSTKNELLATTDSLKGNNKAGQTKFTVYRHKVFDFACGRAVIIQISNQ